jgi:predicted nucleic acid-binding protein
MPLVYADTSALFAYFHPRDEFTRPVAAVVRVQSPDFVWWALHKFELRHNLRLARTDAHGEAAWRALRVAEGTATRLRYRPELQAQSVLEAADDLSADKGNQAPCGIADVWHVAAARRVHALKELDEFWTCDEGQFALAKVCGLPARLFKRPAPAAARPGSDPS